MSHDVNCLPTLQLPSPFGPCKSCENVELSSKITCSPFSLKTISRHPECTNIRPKRSPAITNIMQNPYSKIIGLWTLILVSFWGRKSSKTDPKMITKSGQMVPLVAQGAAWGSQGTPKMSPCRVGVFLCTQNDPKLGKRTPTMTPQMHGQLFSGDKVM